MNKLSDHNKLIEPFYDNIRKLQEYNTYLEKKLKETQTDLERVNTYVKSMSTELEMYKNRKVVRWVNRLLLLNKDDYSKSILPFMEPLEDKYFSFTKNPSNYLLQPSDNLQAVQFLIYSFYRISQKLTGIILVLYHDTPIKKGCIIIEIWSPDNNLLIQKRVDASQIIDNYVTFDFPPIQHIDSTKCYLKVFIKEIDVPVRILEWRKYKLWGFGTVQKKLFCGLIFQ